MSSAARRGGGNSEFSATLTDLMTSLAVIFILLLVVFLKQSHDQSQKAKTEVTDQLERFLKEKSLALKPDAEDPLSLSVQLGESQLRFPVNGYALTSSGAEFVNNFFSNFGAKICDPQLRSKVDSIVIEGHTDRSGEATPQGVRNNIALSQKRSFSVLDEALQSVQGKPEIYECLLKLTSASGRGSRAPVFTKPDEPADAPPVYDPDRSRRVEIKIHVKSAEQQFKALVDKAAQFSGDEPLPSASLSPAPAAAPGAAPTQPSLTAAPAATAPAPATAPSPTGISLQKLNESLTAPPPVAAPAPAPPVAPFRGQPHAFQPPPSVQRARPAAPAPPPRYRGQPRTQ